MWDIKYRPLKFADVLGQQGAVAVLKSRLRSRTALDTSYVFFGGAGQGKTTLARILARAMLCERLNLDDPDPCNECDNCQAVLTETSTAFVEKDAASQGTIEHVRAIVEELPFAIFGASKRIYLFDECHRMSKDSQDVLLKPIEDKRMVAIFCTTEPEKVRGPIRSRCEEYGIRKVTREDIAVRMKWVLELEGAKFEEDAVNTVIDYCGGHVRDVLNKLEMISHMGDVNVANVREYLNLSVVSTYYEILLSLSVDPERALQLIDKACERVTAEEVAAGLAEAAMNSFRQANKMFSDFTYSDKELGTKVYELYGVQTIKLAEFFLRSRHINQVGLTCDALGLSQTLRGGEALPVVPQIVHAVPTFQPVVTVVQQPVSAQATQPQVTPSESPAVEVVVPKPAPLPPTVRPGMRLDGVGNLGQDPMALTEHDAKVVPEKKTSSTPPMKRSDFSRIFGQGSAEDDSLVILPPADWKREFERLLIRK